MIEQRLIYLIKEIEAIPDIYERIQLKTILDRFGVHTTVNISKMGHLL